MPYRTAPDNPARPVFAECFKDLGLPEISAARFCRVFQGFAAPALPGKNRLGQATPLAGPPRSTSEKLKQNKRNGGGQPTRERRTQNYASNQPLTKKANKTQLSRPRGWAHAEPAAAVAKTRGQPRLVTFSKNDSRWKNRGAQRGHKNSTERPEDSLPIGPRPLVSWTGGRIVSQQIHL